MYVPGQQPPLQHRHHGGKKFRALGGAYNGSEYLTEMVSEIFLLVNTVQ